MDKISFETMPAALEEISRKVDRLISLQSIPREETDRLMNLDEFRMYLTEIPARQTIYGWVNDRKVPFEKHGKRLYFRKSIIDIWLNSGRNVKILSNV